MTRKHKLLVISTLLPLTILSSNLFVSCKQNNQELQQNSPTNNEQNLDSLKDEYDVSKWSLESWNKLDPDTKNIYKDFSFVLPHILNDIEHDKSLKELIIKNLLGPKYTLDCDLKLITNVFNQSTKAVKIQLIFNKTKTKNINLNGFATYKSEMYEVYPQTGNWVVKKPTLKTKTNLTNKTLIIPYGVTNIDENGFFEFDVARIYLPNTVIEIGSTAFYHNKSLKNIHLPSSLEIINQHAFTDSGIDSLTIPSRVISIEDRAFSNCSKLSIVNIEIKNDVVIFGESIFGESLSDLNTVNIVIFKDGLVLKKFIDTNGGEINGNFITSSNSNLIAQRNK